MTIGPAPMIMIEAMSVRFGILGSGRAGGAPWQALELGSRVRGSGGL